MSKFKKSMIFIFLGLVIIFIASIGGGKLSIRLGENNFILDKNSLNPVHSEIVSDEKVELKEIKNLKIDCNLSDIELEEGDKKEFILQVVNIDSKDASKIEYSQSNGDVNIYNTAPDEKKLGIYDENSTRFKVILKGPISEINSIDISNRIGLVKLKDIETDNIKIKSETSSVEIENSSISNLIVDSYLSDLDIRSSKLNNCMIGMNTSRIFGHNLIFYGENNIQASKSEGQIGIENYKDLDIDKKTNKGNSIVIKGKLNRIELMDEKNIHNEGE